MNEEEFDSLIKPRPFGTEEAKRAELQYRRGVSLAMFFWCKSGDDLRRQLLTHPPEIPSGFDLGDFRKLQRMTEQISTARSPLTPQIIVAGTQRYTEWEARCEIIRRTIEYLGNR